MQKAEVEEGSRQGRKEAATCRGWEEGNRPAIYVAGSAAYLVTMRSSLANLFCIDQVAARE